jgi:hypothetical protein
MTFSSSSKTKGHSSIGTRTVLRGFAASVAFGLSSSAFAVTSTDFTYSTAKTGYLIIQPSDALPNNSTYAGGYAIQPGLACTNGGCAFKVPIHLPQGAKIVSLAVYYSQPDAGDIYGYLDRYALSNGATAQLMGGSTSDTSNIRKAVVYRPLGGAPMTVQNNGYFYTYDLIVANTGQFYGAKLTYQYTNAGD